MSIKTRILILAASSVLAACGASTQTFGSGASSGAPPALAADRRVPMYDHYCAMLAGGRGGDVVFSEMLDQASTNGWEMVGVSTMDGGLLVCFKRPLESTAPVRATVPPAPAPLPEATPGHAPGAAPGS